MNDNGRPNAEQNDNGRGHADDYINLATALGTTGDKSSWTQAGRVTDLTTQELDTLYEQEAMAARIVDRVVDDATREPFALTGVDESFDWKEVQSELDDLQVLEQLGDTWRWSRLYGGAVCVMVVNDGTPIDKPLDLSRATQILSLLVVERPFAQPDMFARGLGNQSFRRPEIYRLTSPMGGERAVHRSRVIRFDGLRVPPSRLVVRNGWGPSVLDRVWTELKRLGATMGYAEAILHELSVMKLGIKDFRTKAAGSAQGRQELKQVFETIRWAIDNLHLLVHDVADTYDEQTRSTQGLDALIGRFVDALVRATGIPRVILLGEQPSGLNTTADAEVRSWFDSVASQQRKVLTPALNRLLEVYFALRAKRGKPFPTEWTIEYAPLWQPTEKEQADTEKVRAETEVLRRPPAPAPVAP
jgi:hypothetical protein